MVDKQELTLTAFTKQGLDFVTTNNDCTPFFLHTLREDEKMQKVVPCALWRLSKPMICKMDQATFFSRAKRNKEEAMLRKRSGYLEWMNPNKKWKLWDANDDQKAIARSIGAFCLFMSFMALFSPIMGIFTFEMIMLFYVLVVVSALILIAYLIVASSKNENHP